MDAQILENSIDKTQVQLFAADCNIVYGNLLLQIPPLHQKRILTFVNHFVISSCSFLNDFATKCETKIIEVERKMQKVEASLIIIEAKLSSIPGLNEPMHKQELPQVQQTKEETKEPDCSVSVERNESHDQEAAPPSPPKLETGVKACEDARYKKFFKMLQFGVPIDAVRLKMRAEGLDAAIIDTPNAILPDGEL